MNKINKTTDSFQNEIWFNLVVKRITRVFHYMYDPFNDLFETRGIKLRRYKKKLSRFNTKSKKLDWS